MAGVGTSANPIIPTMSPGRIRQASFALVLLLLGAAKPAPSEGYGHSFQAPEGALIAPGKPADLTLLNTGEVLGFVDPCG